MDRQNRALARAALKEERKGIETHTHTHTHKLRYSLDVIFANRSEFTFSLIKQTRYTYSQTISINSNLVSAADFWSSLRNITLDQPPPRPSPPNIIVFSFSFRLLPYTSSLSTFSLLFFPQECCARLNAERDYTKFAVCASAANTEFPFLKVLKSTDEPETKELIFVD